MCRRGRGCGPSPAAYTRPRFPSLGVPGEEAAASASTPAPSPGSTKNQYEAFCALCGLGLMYRVRCTNAQMLGMAELVREPLSSDRYYIYNSYLGEERRAVEGPRTLSCWSRYATGSRYLCLVLLMLILEIHFVYFLQLSLCNSVISCPDSLSTYTKINTLRGKGILV